MAFGRRGLGWPDEPDPESDEHRCRPGRPLQRGGLERDTLVTNFVYLHVDTQFTKITEGPVVTDNEDSWGSVWVDYDVDGDVDLFVANGLFVGNQRNALYRNDGNGVFTRMTRPRRAISSTNRAPGARPPGQIMIMMVCPTLWCGGGDTAFYRNLGQGMFERRLDLVPTTTQSAPGLASPTMTTTAGWIGSLVQPYRQPYPHNSLFHNDSGQAVRCADQRDQSLRTYWRTLRAQLGAIMTATETWTCSSRLGVPHRRSDCIENLGGARSGAPRPWDWRTILERELPSVRRLGRL